MATAGGGVASEQEQTALGYLAEQSGLDEAEVQAAAGANELGRILNALPKAVKAVYYKMKVAEMKVAKEAAAKARPQLVEEVKACMKDKKLTQQAVAEEVRISRFVISAWLKHEYKGNNEGVRSLDSPLARSRRPGRSWWKR
eukprot:SAG22_NODE_945_length_6374_cov_5.969562_7_plen_142_part_00